MITVETCLNKSSLISLVSLETQHGRLGSCSKLRIPPVAWKPNQRHKLVLLLVSLLVKRAADLSFR